MNRVINFTKTSANALEDGPKKDNMLGLFSYSMLLRKSQDECN